MPVRINRKRTIRQPGVDSDKSDNAEGLGFPSTEEVAVSEEPHQSEKEGESGELMDQLQFQMEVEEIK